MAQNSSFYGARRPNGREYVGDVFFPLVLSAPEGKLMDPRLFFLSRTHKTGKRNAETWKKERKKIHF